MDNEKGTSSIMPSTPILDHTDKDSGTENSNKIDFLEIQDSGARQEFETGSVRDTQAGKGRFDLITPFAMRRLAQHYENGAKKYNERNWEKGQPIMRYLESAERHINDLKAALLLGEMTEDHAAAIIWNMFGFIHTEEMLKLNRLPSALDNRPKPYPIFDGAGKPGPLDEAA